jgi:hypothetical protein
VDPKTIHSSDLPERFRSVDAFGTTDEKRHVDQSPGPVSGLSQHPRGNRQRGARAQINDYFLRQLPEEASDKEVGRAIDATIRRFPELIDYYIRYKEEHEEDAKRTSLKRVQYSERVFIYNANHLAHLLATESGFYETPGNTYAESLERIRFLKHVVKDRGGYKTVLRGRQANRA